MLRLNSRDVCVHSGKTSVGKLLGRMLEYPFLDTDKLIEQLSKQTVAEVFEESGEEYFRELETSVLRVSPSCMLNVGRSIVGGRACASSASACA